MAVDLLPSSCKVPNCQEHNQGFTASDRKLISLFFVFSLFVILLADLFHRDAVLCYAVWCAFLVMLPVILSEVQPGPCGSL